MKNETKITYIPINIEPNEDGFLAKCPAIQGAFAEGDTIKEALFNCLDVIEMIFEYRKERGERNLDFGFRISELLKICLIEGR